ncbi:Leucyl-tRNA synthetase, mitochondrial, partial [Spiromyces aspiralis]
MGWDAFGLPAENAAIERKIPPAKWTKNNIAMMREQLKSILTDFNWDREIATCDPEYYRWTQHIFLQLYEQGLVYQKEAMVNWDPIDQTVLANEQVDKNGRSWRSGALVEKRKLKQWFIRISDYADELLKGLESLPDWPDNVKQMQANWIGRSEGSKFTFRVVSPTSDSAAVAEPVTVFTSRSDTIFGVGYLAVSVDHPIVSASCLPRDTCTRVFEFAERVGRMSPEELAAERSGVYTGLEAVHPLLPDVRVPIYVAAYVLSDYGTGAVMGVPAHDTRDYEFARANGLADRIVPVVEPEGSASTDAKLPYIDRGVLRRIPANGEFGGLASEEAGVKITDLAKDRGAGGPAVQYRLRDWLVSRQRYWGTPIPVVHCDSCGPVPVPEHQLPVKLPDVGPEGRSEITGSPLQRATEWVKTTCPRCHEPATRDTDTMDTFVDSS